MGLYDRPYMRDDQQGFYGSGPGGHMRLALPKPTRLVLGLMIACALVFFLTLLSGRSNSPLYRWLSLRAVRSYQLWRFVTFQFVHGDPSHFLFNMIGLYFFAPPLERAFGGKKFLVFYLGCGAFAGLCFLGVSGLWSAFDQAFLVGASGGVLACLMACAILFPRFIVLIFPIRWVAAFLVVLYALGVMWWENPLGDVAHLGGMAAAAVWLWALPRLRGAGSAATRKVNQGAWQRKLAKRADRQKEIDRILRKIHRHGIASLTGGERKKLRDATRNQQQEDRNLHKM